MHHVTLEDALELVILYAEAQDAKFDRAACRWLGRLIVERENLTLVEAQLAAFAQCGLKRCTADRGDDAPVDRKLGSRMKARQTSS